LRNGRATPLTLAALLLGVLGSREARAADMDPATERLVTQPGTLPPGQTCQSIAANPGAAVAAGLNPQELACRPNNLAFRQIVSELGFAIAPTAFYPARTTGWGGFQFTFEASYTSIYANRTVSNSDGTTTQYWNQATRGKQDPNTKKFDDFNSSPDSVLQIYGVKARKGLPFGFELGGFLGSIANTTMWVTGGDLRWAPLEGFRTGALGLLPDISVGGGVRTLTGTSRFYLTTVGLDVRISKHVNIEDSAQIIPQIGFQRLIIFGDSNVVDATPNVDPVQQCGQTGNNPQTGAPICSNKLPNGADANHDYANNFTFDKVRVHRNKVIFALNYKYELLWLGSQIGFDFNLPKDEDTSLVGKRQWTLTFEAGVNF
jgi:hypothetical protein